MATCPECDAEIEIDEDDLKELQAGDSWDCDACGSRLQVVTLDPLEFEVDDEDEDDEEAEEKTSEDSDFEDLDEDDDADEDDDWEE